MTGTREENVFKAKLAEVAGRFEDMASFMDNAVEALAPGEELTAEERVLFHTAYDNISYVLLDTLGYTESMTADTHRRAALLKSFRAKIEAELTDICYRVIRLLDHHLLPSATETESRIFYFKMKGDYYRDLTSVKTGNELKDADMHMYRAYNEAQLLADYPIMLDAWGGLTIFDYLYGAKKIDSDSSMQYLSESILRKELRKRRITFTPASI